MNSPNVFWKLLDIVANDRKGNDPSAPELLYHDSAGIQVLHGAYSKHHLDYWDLDDSGRIFWMVSIVKEVSKAWQDLFEYKILLDQAQ